MIQNKNFLRPIFPGVLLAVGAAMIIFLFIQNKSLKTQTEQQRMLIAQQSQLMDSLRIRSLSNLMPQLLARINDELKDNPGRVLSDETISMIASLSYTLKPYPYTEGARMSTKKLSPERGQLLLILIGLNLDTGSLHQIMKHVSFAGADLRDGVLRGADLSGINLSEADLSSAIFDSADLAGANLSYANLWGAIISKAKLTGTDLTRADLQWANLNQADLKGADLREANLYSVQMRNADLSGSVMKWTNLTGAFLNEANLAGADMFRTTLVRAQLTGAILSEANMTVGNLIEANVTGSDMTGINLTDVIVDDKNWLSRLNEWQVIGAEELQRNYKLSHEVSNGKSIYRLKKLEN